jgi:hypothetical protein
MTPISSAQGVAALSPIGLEPSLTPDALMTYSKSRLQNLDASIHEHFSRQQDLRNASSAIGALQQKLTDAATLKEGIKADDAQTRDEITAQFESALAALPEGHPKRAEILQVYAFYKSTLVDAIVSTSELNSMAQNVGSVMKDLSSSAELDMISLQSLMTQRQTAIQLCTNLVAALGESTKLIAQRIGA